MKAGRSPGRSTVIALNRRTAQAMVERLVSRLGVGGFSISGGHHPVFENIDPEGTRLTTLAARAEMTHQAMGELVKTLEDRGYVERRVDERDRRARLIRLTPRGRRMVARAISEIDMIERDWLTSLRRAGLRGDVKSALDSALSELERSAGP